MSKKQKGENIDNAEKLEKKYNCRDCIAYIRKNPPLTNPQYCSQCCHIRAAHQFHKSKNYVCTIKCNEPFKTCPTGQIHPKAQPIHYVDNQLVLVDTTDTTNENKENNENN